MAECVLLSVWMGQNISVFKKSPNLTDTAVNKSGLALK